jgi:hypothetical protein
MDPKPEPDWSVIQWLITTFLGIVTFFYGFITKNIYSEIKTIKEKQETMSKEMSENTNKGDDSLWQALEAIRTRMDQVAAKDEILRIQASIDEDRKQAAADRSNIAVMMATKNELARQLDKLFERLTEVIQKR